MKGRPEEGKKRTVDEEDQRKHTFTTNFTTCIWQCTKLTEPVLPLFLVVQGVGLILKEGLHLILPTLPAGMYQIQPQNVVLNSVRSVQGLVG